MDSIKVVDGFSLTNRWLLYTSVMLAPAQFLSGIDSNSPGNLGFLAYNWYTQISWYKAVKARELHALSLLPVHFNLIYAITYLGGITSGNIYMGLLLGFGTAGVMVLNTLSAWQSWVTNQPEGLGEYKFFFFGWRTLTEGWHKFFLVWQIGDSMIAFSCIITAIAFPIALSSMRDKITDASIKIPGRGLFSLSSMKYPLIPIGAAVILFGAWPLILWVELIVQKNHIESDTDMIAVYLFIAQAVALIIPKYPKRGLGGPQNEAENGNTNQRAVRK